MKKIEDHTKPDSLNAKSSLSRRSFLTASGGAAALGVLGASPSAAAAPHDASTPAGTNERVTTELPIPDTYEAVQDTPASRRGLARSTSSSR